MTDLYRANIKKMYVKKLQFSEKAVPVIETGSHVLHSDALFYEGMLGKIISFDYGTVLLNSEEAHYYLENYSIRHPDDLENATCPYVDDDDFRYEKSVNKKKLLELQTAFKQNKRY